MGKLEGRIALITAGNSGIDLCDGEAVCERKHASWPERSRPKEIHSGGGNKSSALPVP